MKTKEQIREIIKSQLEELFQDTTEGLLDYSAVWHDDDDCLFDYVEGFISGLVRIGAITNKEYSDYLMIIQGKKEIEEVFGEQVF